MFAELAERDRRYVAHPTFFKDPQGPLPAAVTCMVVACG
jgi:hypothetical protein